MLIKLSTWSCLLIRIQDEVLIKRLIVVRLKGCKNSNICDKPEQIKILFRKIEVRECLLSFGAESIVFQFSIEKYKD